MKFKNRQEIEDDVVIKVRTLLESTNEGGFARVIVQKLIDHGSGILEEHTENGGNYFVPKAVVSAIFQDMADNFLYPSRLSKPKARKHKILRNKYRMFV